MYETGKLEKSQTAEPKTDKDEHVPSSSIYFKARQSKEQYLVTNMQSKKTKQRSIRQRNV